MGRFYSDADVARWADVYQKSIDLHLEKLATTMPEQKIDFHLGMLSGSYYMHGMTCIAKCHFRESIDAFRKSIETKCKMYERYKTGQGRAMEAGYFQSVLIAFVTRDDGLITKLVSLYRADDGTPNSMFLGKALKAIASFNE